MHKYLVRLILVLIIFTSCKKKRIEVEAIQISIPTEDRLNKIQFFNSEIGFAIGGARYSKAIMIKTIDGGATWTQVQLPTNGGIKEIYGIDMLQNGTVITVGFSGSIYLSKDTGNSFQYIQHNSWNPFQDVTCRDADTALLVGGQNFNEGSISFFKNNGTGVNSATEDRNFEITDIAFPSNTIGYLCGYGALMKTLDGGHVWNYTTAENDYFKAMCWKNTEEGIVVGYEGSILKTEDAGQEWKKIRNGNSITKKKYHFLDIANNGASIYAAVGEKGVFYVSKNDGETWNEADAFTNEDLRGVTFKDASTCFVVGENGTLYQVKL